MRDVLHIIADVERAKQYRGTQEQRVELADWLVHTPYSLRQIRKAAQSIAVMETYGRPFAREFWFKAFAQPLIDSRRIRELCRKAYEKGRKDGRKEIEAKNGKSPDGMDPTAKRLLEAEKELMMLRDGDRQQKTRISSLEREIRRLQRYSGESAAATFYRIGDRLVVEHFRENGQVYYHEQEVSETGIPWDRCRCLPEAEFDRQLAARNPVILTEAEIVRLPGYRHWSTGE